MFLNRDFLRGAINLFRSGSDLTVEVHSGNAMRAVLIAGGQLVGARSNLVGDLLGEILVADGKLDRELLPAIERKAKEEKRQIGAQLMAEHLITAEELALALSRQILVRFMRASSMPGSVKVKALGSHGNAVCSVPQAVIELFRQAISFDIIEELASDLPSGRLQISISAEEMPRLDLDARASDLAQALVQPFTARELMKESDSYEAAMRFLVAVDVLGYLHPVGAESSAG